MDITLYHAPGACSTGPYISLLEAGADFDVALISLRNNEHLSDEYAALNPKRKVPYLVVDGRGLSENVAIQSWIAETFPDAGLLPSDPWEHKQALSYMSWFGSGMHPHITRHFKTAKFCAQPEAETDIKKRAKAMLFEQLRLADEVLAGRTWFFDHFTACDAYFFWVFDRALREGFDLGEFTAASAHYERMRALSSVQKVMAHKAA